MQFVLAPLVALVVVLVLTPHVRRLAFRVGALDSPDHRKVHQGVMPRLGGPAIYLAFVPCALAVSSFRLPVLGLALGATLILILGVADDTRGVSPRVKLAGQIIAALSGIPFGIKVTFITNPFNNDIINLGIFAVPITVFWLVAVTNAFNLIDGLDGLAGGVSCISSLTMAAVAFTQLKIFGVEGQYEIIALSLILASSTLGFMRYNFYPASIFLGDSGSMLLGFSLGVISIMGLAKSATAISVIIPMVVMGIPLLDTLFTIVRRFHENRPIFQPDREHLHHRLLDLGLNHRQVVLAIYGVNTVLGGIAVFLTVISQGPALLLVEGIVLATMVAANMLGITGQRLRTKYLISWLVVLYGLNIFVFLWTNFRLAKL